MNIKDINFIAFDIETTGLNPLEDDILEVAAVRFTISGGILDVFSSLVFSSKVISDKVISIHGITSDMVKDSPSIDFVLSEFNDFIKDDYLFAHNASFDTGFIAYNLLKYNMLLPENLIYDTLSLARSAFEHIGSYSLSNLKELFGITVENSHRALDDSIAIMQLFSRIISSLKFYYKGIDSLASLSSPISFASYGSLLFSLHREDIDKINFAKDNNLSLVITYLDSSNKLTTREVTTPSIMLTYGNIYIDCHCFLRGERRKFRLDRVKSISFKK